MDQDARALIGQLARDQPTHAVRRPGDQYGFVCNVHATKDRQNLVHGPLGRLAEMRGPYGLNQVPAGRIAPKIQMWLRS
jgi:hypothetical protein